ncbi:S41 family peptidase [Enterococcus casseliflavus]|uniref:S41 family peptidase n=1 Tax=Enterococcus casseliflavus TaxID=37734 RepID=UPI0039A42ED0
MKRRLKLIVLLTVIILPILTYWVPRVSLDIMNEAIYIIPPSKNKFISDIIYISKRKGIHEEEKTNEYVYKEKYDSYSEAISDLSPFLTANYGKHTEIIKYESEDEKYSKFVSLQIVSIDRAKVATITLPRFSGNTSEEEKYITTVQKFIELNKEDIKGVIVDLSTNNGGNLDVLIASLAQFLPNGTLFNFVDNESNRFPVRLSDSEIVYDDHNYPISSQEKLNIPVVVLGSNTTASSAEILLLTIISNIKQSIFIGQSTGGYLSGREGFKLYDDYYLGISTRTIETNDGVNHNADEPLTPAIESPDSYKDAKQWIDKIIYKDK